MHQIWTSISQSNTYTLVPDMYPPLDVSHNIVKNLYKICNSLGQVILKNTIVRIPSL